MNEHLQICAQCFTERKWLRDQYRAGKFKPIGRLEPRQITDDGKPLSVVLWMSLRSRKIKHWRPAAWKRGI